MPPTSKTTLDGWSEPLDDFRGSVPTEPGSVFGLDLRLVLGGEWERLGFPRDSWPSEEPVPSALCSCSCRRCKKSDKINGNEKKRKIRLLSRSSTDKGVCAGCPLSTALNKATEMVSRTRTHFLNIFTSFFHMEKCQASSASTKPVLRKDQNIYNDVHCAHLLSKVRHVGDTRDSATPLRRLVCCFKRAFFFSSVKLPRCGQL